MSAESKCPVTGTRASHEPRLVAEPAEPSGSPPELARWPIPMGEAFDYAKEFKSLDLNAVIKDLMP